MIDILERLTNSEILVGDGAMGTMLFTRGLKQGKPPESICLSNPKILEKIAQAYLEAGADIIETNTFGGSPLRLLGFGLQERAEEINRIAVESVKKVVEDKAYISGSIGPSGKMLKPFGDTDPEDIYRSFERQIEILINSSVDLLCIETMIDLNEAMIAVKAARNISSEIPIIATLTFDETPQGFKTIMGDGIKTCCIELEKAGVNIIGSNCGVGIENMINIAREFKKYSQLPIIIQANAGLPNLQDDKLFYPETPEFFAKKTKVLIDAGVSIIGGCCGTTPEHIKAIREVVDKKS